MCSAHYTCLQDAESDVRAGASKCVSGYHDLVGNDKFVSEVVPAIRELSTDLSLPVRASLAASVMDVSSKMPAPSASTHILPLVMQFLRDESAEVTKCAPVSLSWCYSFLSRKK